MEDNIKYIKLFIDIIKYYEEESTLSRKLYTRNKHDYVISSNNANSVRLIFFMLDYFYNKNKSINIKESYYKYIKNNLKLSCIKNIKYPHNKNPMINTITSDKLSNLFNNNS